MKIDSVLTRGTTAQPASPAIGDRYLLPTAATGADWAGKDDLIGIYTNAGWFFVMSPVGRFLYIEDEGAFYSRNAAGDWTAYVGASLASVVTMIGANASFVVKVENQTTNTPPGSPTAGTGYIIGSSPTGAWAGSPGKLALCIVDGAFTIVTPVAGDEVYDKALQVAYTYSGSAWVASTSGMVNSKTAGIVPGSFSSGGSGTYAWSTVTAPTTAPQYNEDSRVLTYTAKAAGNKLVFHYAFDGNNASMAGLFTAALFEDAGSNAVDWRLVGVRATAWIAETLQFAISAPDALEHTYKVRIIYNTSGGAANLGGLASRLFRVEEYQQ